MRTKALTVLATLAVAASLALGSTAFAQDEGTGTQPADEGTAATDTPVLPEGAEDLWLLSSQDTVTRLDGETGEVVAQLDVAADGCYWQRMVGPADGAVWLMMDWWWLEYLVARGIDATSFCIGRFPIDGSAPEIFSIDPGNDAINVEDAAVLGDALWFAARRERGMDAPKYPLYRLDLSGGAESAELEQVAEGIGALGVLDGDLVVGRNVKSKNPLKPARWRPATFDPTSGEFRNLDIPLGKKDTFGGGITVGDGLIALLDDKKPVVYDPASGTLTRVNLPKNWT